jgi:hypothetical protein
VAAELAGVIGSVPLSGDALGHARAMVAAAVETIEQIAEHGWRPVAGEHPPSRSHARPGRGAVVDRGDSFDPFAASLGGRRRPGP